MLRCSYPVARADAGWRSPLISHRAGGGVDGGRRGTTRTPTDEGRLGDAGSDGGPALGAGPMSVGHGRDGRRRRTER